MSNSAGTVVPAGTATVFTVVPVTEAFPALMAVPVSLAVASAVSEPAVISIVIVAVWSLLSRLEITTPMSETSPSRNRRGSTSRTLRGLFTVILSSVRAKQSSFIPITVTRYSVRLSGNSKEQVTVPSLPVTSTGSKTAVGSKFFRSFNLSPP